MTSAGEAVEPIDCIPVAVVVTAQAQAPSSNTQTAKSFAAAIRRNM